MNFYRTPLALAAVVIVTSIWGTTAEAVVFSKPPPFSGIKGNVAEAQIIIDATVVGSTTHLHDTPSGALVPFTEFTMHVNAAYRGATAGQQIIIFVPGGLVGDEMMQIAGQAYFTVGERVLAFINTRDYPLLSVVRGNSGFVRLVTASEGERILDYAWRPLTLSEDGRLDVLTSARCVPAQDRTQCLTWDRPGEVAQSLPPDDSRWASLPDLSQALAALEPTARPEGEFKTALPEVDDYRVEFEKITE